MSSERIKQLCDYIDRNKAKNYPIKNEILKSEEEFVKNGYLRMLAVVLQVGDSIQDGQMNLYKRMVAGAETENSVEDYMRQAMEIEIQEYLDFVNACKEGELKYRFVLDAMLLTVDGEEKENRLKFLSSFCEDIKLKKEEMSYLVAMAKAILEQSESKYVDAFIEKDMENVAIEEDVFDGYMSGIWTGKDNIYENEKATIFRPESDEDVTSERLQYMQNTGTPYVKIVGVKINLSKRKLKFDGKHEVIFENCKFSGHGKDEFSDKSESLMLTNCNIVQFYNCKFENFDTYTLIVECVKQMKIVKSEFQNCIYCYTRGNSDWKILGGVIYSENPLSNGKIEIQECMLKNCGGRNSQIYYSSQFISNCDVEAYNCKFFDCWHENDCKWRGMKLEKGRIDPEDERRTMFTPASTAIGCELENSADFN